MKGLGTTSYAILGLLALRPFTTYELAHEMRRSTHYMWPRAESGLYEEPKNLVEHGLARSTRDFVGRRQRTTYTITPKGRRALRSWLKEPSEPPALEFEGLLKVLYAELGTKQDLLATLAETDADARDTRSFLAGIAREVATGEGPFPFPNRRHVNYLVLTLQEAQSTALMHWVRFARREVASWPDDARLPSNRDFRRRLDRLAATLENP